MAQRGQAGRAHAQHQRHRRTGVHGEVDQGELLVEAGGIPWATGGLEDSMSEGSTGDGD